jgi:hypothetical protein
VEIDYGKGHNPDLTKWMIARREASGMISYDEALDFLETLREIRELPELTLD